MATQYAICLETPFAATTGAKTALLALASSADGLVIVEFGITFDGVTASAVPALVEIVSTTAATAGTPTGTPTVTQWGSNLRQTGTAPTAGGRYSAEPTTLVRLAAWYVPPTSGYVEQYPLGREPVADSSGGTIKGLGIRINVSANVNAMCYMIVEKN